MSLEILIIVILLQVLTFQFAMIRLSRALPDYLAGTQDLPAVVRDGVERFKRTVGRMRYLLGASLMAAAVLVTYVLPLGRAGSKLGLAAVSLISGAACAIGYVLDRRKVAALARRLPEPSVRSASLLRGAVSLHYSPLWEGLPLLILLATVVATLGTSAGSGATGTARHTADLVVLPIVQGIYVLGCLLFTLWSVRSGSRLPQKSKAFLGTPERAVGIENELRRLEFRFFMIAKITIALLLGLMQLDRILVHSGRGVPPVLDLSPWVLVLFLLGLYLAFLLRSARVGKTLTL